MVGGDENLVVMNEWAAPSPSPRSFFSSLLKDGISAISCSNMAQDNKKQWPPSVAYEQKAATSMDEAGIENGSEGFGAGDSLSETKVLSVQKPSSRSSFSERMATRGGFKTPSVNITKVSGLSSCHPDVRSSCLTIPSGLSPTTLLDSPVFLSNSLTQQSPTTGKISSELLGEKRLRSASLGKDQSIQDISAASFAFKPHPGSSTSCFPSRPQSHRLAATANGHQPRPSIEVSVMPVRPAAARNLEVTNSQQQELQPPHLFSDDIKKNGNVSKSTEVASDDTEIKRPPVEQEDMGDDYRGEYYSTLVEAPSEDGYNWRKYGQKQVKGSEFPRSYYKCTHPDCPVKKKLERSQEGHITEIIYKGAHNHSKPQARRWSATGSSSHLLSDQQQSMWAPGEGPFAALAGEFCDQLATIADEGASREKVHAAVDVLSAESNEEEDECVSQRGQEDEEDDSESKRRKLDSYVTEMSGNSRSIREPRVVVQTTSEVDILDDGYRWRKYGQKVVKGNPNPRSYYKCTNAGCNVRKHVQRASHDLKSVITTYEGKHNHDVPAAKNNSHVNSASSSLSSVSSAPFVSRPEPSMLHQELPIFANPLLRRQILGSPGFSFSVGRQSFSNLAMGCLGSATQSKMPRMQMHQSFYENQGKGNALGFMMPEEEPKEPAPFTSNIPLGASIYHQLMSRLPL